MKVTLPLTALKNYGAVLVPDEMANGEIPTQVKALDHLFYSYLQFCSSRGPTTLPLLRWELFRSKKVEGQMLPHIYMQTTILDAILNFENATRCNSSNFLLLVST